MAFTLREPRPEDVLRSAVADLQRGSPLEGVGQRYDWSDLRCVIYARISQAEKNDVAGVSRQVDICTQRITDRGGVLAAKPFIDNDVSASRFSDKPLAGRDAMMAMTMAGEADLIVVYDASRLFRRRTEFAALLDLFEREAARFAVVTVEGNTDLTTAHGRFQATMDNSLAIMESEKISARQKLQVAAQADAGKPRTSRRAFGWQQDGVTPHPEESRILQAAWRRILEEGVGIIAIARQWTEDGVRATRGQPMNWVRRDASVRKILTNPRHVGDLVHKGVVHRRDAWEGIIAREDFERVLALLRTRTAALPPRSPLTTWRTVPYTGLLICGRCEAEGHPDQGLERSVTSAKRGGHFYYRCNARFPGYTCGLSILAKPVEELIRAAAFAWAENPRFQELTATVGDDDGEQAAALARTEQVEERMAETDAMWNAIPPEMTRESYRRNMAELTRQRAEVQQTLERLARVGAMRIQRAHSATVRDRWPSLSTEEQRMTLHTIVDRVVIASATRHGPGFDPTRVHIHLVGET